MVREFESLIRGLRQAGFEQAAGDVKTVLAQHRQDLPPRLGQTTIPETFAHGTQVLPINQETLADPAYMRSMLQTLLKAVLLPHEQPPEAIYNAISRSPVSQRLSFAQLMGILDDPSQPYIRRLGPTRREILRRATELIRQKFYPETPPT